MKGGKIWLKIFDLHSDIHLLRLLLESESLSCKARGESCSRPDVKKYGRCLTLDCPIYAQAFTTACNLVAQQMLTNAESPLAA